MAGMPAKKGRWDTENEEEVKDDDHRGKGKGVKWASMKNKGTLPDWCVEHCEQVLFGTTDLIHVTLNEFVYIQVTRIPNTCHVVYRCGYIYVYSGGVVVLLRRSFPQRCSIQLHLQ